MLLHKTFFTKPELVSGKLPLEVVWQLGGVNKCVVISFSALDDLPTNLIFGFLRGETCQQVVTEAVAEKVTSQGENTGTAVAQHSVSFSF